MANSVVQSTFGTVVGNKSSINEVFSQPVAKGNLLLAGIGFETGSSATPVTVQSVIDSGDRRWIQVGSSYNANVGSEIWMCRGATSTAEIVTVGLTGVAASVSVNLIEVAGAALVPVDQWGQNFGTSASATSATITPRQNGDLFFTVSTNTGGIISTPASYTNIGTNRGIGTTSYLISSSSVSSTPISVGGSSGTWAVTTAAFQAGGVQNPAGTQNPLLQFPEVQVQISAQTNWAQPLLGTGTWTDVTEFVQSFNVGPIGRQHELDRVQSAPGQFIFDNRYGQFNSWNTQSFLYGNGTGLDPMTPIRVVAAWNGITYPIYYGYFQSLTNSIKNVLDVDAQLDTIDIFQILSLKYLASNNYAALIEADGGPNLVAYYRCGDQIGNYYVTDSSGNRNTGSLISGVGGTPAYGAAGPLLYDANTGVDLTNGTNVPNGGIQMVDNTINPPLAHDPLSAASTWTLECWAQWTQSAPPSASVAAIGTGSSVAAVPNGVLFHATASVAILPGVQTIEFQAGVGPIASMVYNPAYVFATSASTTPVAQVNPIIAANVFDGGWHHVAIVGNPSTNMQFFLDGQPQQLQGLAGGVVQTINLTNVCIGSPPTGTATLQLDNPVAASVLSQPSAQWAGSMDEIAIYNIALSATQIANHYAQGKWFQSIELGAATGGTSTNRLAKVLALCGIPTSILNVPYPWRTELYAETNPVTTTSGLNYIQNTTESEPGLIFQGPNGQIQAYSRQYQYLNPTSITSQGIFGDNNTTAQYYYEGTAFTLGQDDLDLFNDIQVQSGRGGYQLSATDAIAGGSQLPSAAPFTVGGGQLMEWGPNQSTTLATSASVYGSRTLQGLTSLQQQYDSDALAIAQNYALWYGQPLERIDQIVVNSTSNGGNAIPQMLGRGVYDRLTIQYQGQVQGPQFTQDSLIEGVSHAITMADGPTWKTTWAMSPFEILFNPVILSTWTFGTPASQSVLTL